MKSITCSKTGNRFEVGDIVLATFLDHTSGGDGLLQFNACGRIARITPISITIQTWWYTHDPETLDENTETFSLVRKAILQLDPPLKG